MLSRRDFLKLLAGTGTSAFFAPYAKDNPRVKRVYLLETRVAGFQYHEGVKPEVAAQLAPGADLILAREPQNEHDEAAIAVYTPQGAKVGYVPRALNEIPAFIADQGVFLGAEILSFRPDWIENAPWDCLRVKLFQAIPLDEAAQ